MLYEIINMSDPYTIEAPSLDVAFVACIFLGEGQYAFKPLEAGVEEVPLFLFGGAETWCEKHFGQSPDAVVQTVIDKKRLELADCFDSCLIGRAEDRETYAAGLALIDADDPEAWIKRSKWYLDWHERRRSSMNDIGARARKMANNLREGAQVFGS